ncbi:glycoside hydrolase family 13 protein [Dactylosporangium sp. NPDC005555]|uniref:glycoside hydrolase family 13 protein n=1 Tax=Dactylosporangium sp. NPDC005555 TaxID=3154889 RepID=UPI0033A0B6C4
MVEWWRHAVIYQVYPRSFADADGDGVGDLPGITARLGHLADLGVDALWLSPFYRSPMVDGGYDVSDHRDVDPVFGTLADFDALLAEAHRLGLRVIVDIVPNHTSSRHPWFVDGRRDRYVFRDEPNGWQSLFGGPAWTRVADGQWYLHLFDPEQPDLNWHNPEVREEFDDILRFWLDRGVDGFRVDVAHGMIKDLAGVTLFDHEDVHEIHRRWRKILDSYPGERMAVAEVFDTAPARVARYVSVGELHQAFNFDFLEAPWEPAVLRRIIDASLRAAAAVGAPPTWVLSNHDRRRHVTRFGGVRRARAAVLLMLGLPGSAYLYQGEELGLPEVLDLPDEVRTDPQWVRSGGEEPGRDGCRVPLPWSGDAPPFGFGPGGSWLPQPADWAGLTVEAQRLDPHSTLSLYRDALRLRRPSDALRWLDAPDGVLLFETDTMRVAANLSGVPIRVMPATPLLSSNEMAGELPPDTTAWWTI